VRPNLDQSLMAIATVWEQRSTCGRNHVGAVIVKGGRHIGSGYNGAPAGMPHCEHITQNYIFQPGQLTDHPALGYALGSPNRNKGCIISVHAEANAIAYCARDGISIEGATIYTTLSPCYTCCQLIIAGGIVRVVYTREYRDVDGLGLLRAAGIIVDRLA
jgi:dCMP deaminase